MSVTKSVSAGSTLSGEDDHHSVEKNTLTRIYVGLGILYTLGVCAIEIGFLFYIPFVSLVIATLTSNFDPLKVHCDFKRFYKLDDKNIKKILVLTTIKTTLNIVVMTIATVLILQHFAQFYDLYLEQDI